MIDTITSDKVSTGSKGAISELIVMVDLMRRGYEVFRAASPHSSCDLIALKDGHSIRIEVKGRTLAKHREKISTSWKSKNYDARRFDVLALVSGNDIRYRRSMFNGLNPASEELVLPKINNLQAKSLSMKEVD